MTPTYTVLHRDATLLVADKAPGVLTVGHAGSRERCLLDDLRRDGHRVAPVHRLDKETSGVLLLCLDPSRRAACEAIFRERKADKQYLAAVHGVPNPRAATIDVPILDTGKSARVDRRGRRAVSHYEVEERLERSSLVRVRIDTGRHNQIRVHMAHIGHPVVGDRKFGRRGAAPPGVKRSLLHAARLAFRHPVGGRRMTIEAPLPADMADWVAAARS